MNIEYVPAKTLITTMKHKEYWFGYDFNLNLYRGCSHGCIYCDSRSECYHVEQFDKIKVKETPIETLQRELSGKRKKGVIGTGAMSDPYNPLEQKLQLTRQSLSLLYEYGYGVAITTKSDLITRDIDILKKINEYQPVLCCITVTTPHDNLSQQIEPRVSSSSKRLEAIRQLSEAGIFTGVLLTPVLPFITDKQEDITQLVTQAKAVGAKFVYAGFGVTLRDRQREHYYQNLERLFPTLKQKYIAAYQNQYDCHIANEKEIKQAFRNQCEEAGLLYRMSDIIAGYRNQSEPTQLSLF